MMRNLGIQDPNMKEKASVVYISRCVLGVLLCPSVASQLICSLSRVSMLQTSSGQAPADAGSAQRADRGNSRHPFG